MKWYGQKQCIYSLNLICFAPLQGEANDSIEFEKEAFIEAVRELRCLWDVNSPMFKDRTSKQNAWKKLAITFNKEGNAC